jgi:hypothetical protein
MRRIAVVVAVAAGVTALVAQAAPSAPRPPIRLSGTATLQAVDISVRCNFGRGANNTVIAACSQIGAFAGRPARAGVAYAWRWDLELGPDGRTTTGNGPERGELALNFGAKRGILRVTTTGRQAPVGTPTADQAQGRTVGTWKFKSGTKTFARRRGTGTYRFDTTRIGPTTFEIARITINGTLR